MALVGSWLPTGNDQSRLTQELRVAIQRIAEGSNMLLAIVGVQAQMTSGGQDFSTVETYFTLAPGSGSAVKDVIGSASAALQGAAVQALFQRLG